MTLSCQLLMLKTNIEMEDTSCELRGNISTCKVALESGYVRTNVAGVCLMCKNTVSGFKMDILITAMRI